MAKGIGAGAGAASGAALGAGAAWWTRLLAGSSARWREGWLVRAPPRRRIRRTTTVWQTTTWRPAWSPGAMPPRAQPMGVDDGLIVMAAGAVESLGRGQ